jgi:hypothetical protein
MENLSIYEEIAVLAMGFVIIIIGICLLYGIYLKLNKWH